MSNEQETPNTEPSMPSVSYDQREIQEFTKDTGKDLPFGSAYKEIKALALH